MMLTLRATDHIGSGPYVGNWNRVIRYTVEGLPPGEEAWIADFHYKWQLLRRTDGVQGEWMGAYKSPEDALTALQEQISRRAKV